MQCEKIEEKNGRYFSDISENVTEVSYRSWFAPLVPMEIDEDAASLSTSPHQKADHGSTGMRYIPVFERAVESVLSQKYKVVVKTKQNCNQQQLNMGTTQIPSGNNPCFPRILPENYDQYAEAEGSGFAGRE